jgi:SAM-dependent methyltransferase
VWFSESGVEEKIIRHLNDLAEEGSLIKGDNEGHGIDHAATSFLDLGTGNGHLLVALREEGFAGYMLGIDYSESSIQLAKQIEQTRQRVIQDGNNSIEESFAPIDFQELDILAPHTGISNKFDVLLDKGTFDAISLSSKIDMEGRRTSELYRSNIKLFLRNGGIFIITSCNWTEDELRKWCEAGDTQNGTFAFECRLKYSTFRFQGQVGQTVVTICFRKR